MKLFTNIKAIGLSLFLGAFLVLFALPAQQANARGGVHVNFQVFYDNLVPYGTWFNDPQYGYVWAPRVSRDFRPYYTNGYWVNTNYGNMWMSQYSWGWAAFHYGRWAYSDYYGWIWIPGQEWGPAWVTWRQGSGCYGWAPMGPGVTVSASFNSGYYVPRGYWTFIPYGRLYSHSFHRYYSPSRTRNIYRNTTIINNTYIYNRNTYVTGPRRRDVERRTGRAINIYQVDARSRAGRSNINGHTANIYRPAVRRSRVEGDRAPRPESAKRVSHSIISSPDRSNANSRAHLQNNRIVSPSKRRTIASDRNNRQTHHTSSLRDRSSSANHHQSANRASRQMVHTRTSHVTQKERTPQRHVQQRTSSRRQATVRHQAKRTQPRSTRSHLQSRRSSQVRHVNKSSHTNRHSSTNSRSRHSVRR